MPLFQTSKKIQTDVERWRASGEHEQAFEYEKWMKEIPFIKFPAGWEVRVTPPFAAAMVRFAVKHGESFVSVYLDCHCMLGNFDRQPHWEIYPYWYRDEKGIWEETNHRIPMKDTEELVKCIQQSLDYKGNE